MLTERQLLSDIDAAVASGAADRLRWAARAALRFLSEFDGSRWLATELSARMPAWQAAYERVPVAQRRQELAGLDAFESLRALLHGGSVDVVRRTRVPEVEPALNNAEYHAAADYLLDEERLREIRGVFILPSEPEPVIAIGAIDLHAAPLVRLYHEGLIERPWASSPWRAETALIEDAVLMAFAVGDLRDPCQISDVTQRLRPSLLELDGDAVVAAEERAFKTLVDTQLLESTGLDSYRASPEGMRAVVMRLLPTWFAAQQVAPADFP
ncbi:MAG: hypothetical protein AAF108_09695 [Planctomycetota bacterium]